jgi:hypothetical protein
VKLSQKEEPRFHLITAPAVVLSMSTRTFSNSEKDPLEKLKVISFCDVEQPLDYPQMHAASDSCASPEALSADRLISGANSTWYDFDSRVPLPLPTRYHMESLVIRYPPGQLRAIEQHCSTA